MQQPQSPIYHQQRRRSISTPDLNLCATQIPESSIIIDRSNDLASYTLRPSPSSILRKAEASLGEPVTGSKSLRWNEESNIRIPSPPAIQINSNDYSQSEIMSDAESVKTTDLMEKWDLDEEGNEIIGGIDDLSIHTEDEDAISQTSFKESDIIPVSNLDKEMKGFYNRPSIVNILQDEKSKSTLNEIISTDPLSRMSQTLEKRRSSVVSLQQEPMASPSNQIPSSTSNVTPSTKPKEEKKYGLVEGVYIPCISSVLGTILFLKVPWILANAGLAFSLLYIFISVICAILTWLSLTSVVTNGLLKSGGTIAIMSRVIGNQFAGSLGLIYFVGFIFLLSLHSFAAADLLMSTVRIFFPYFKMVDSDLQHPYWDLIILAIGFLLLIFFLVFIGFRHVVRFELVFIITTFITILLFIIGCFVTVKTEYHITSAKWSNFVNNFPPQFQHGQDFFSVMAVIFPSVVGILAGINRSGHVKHIQRNIPIGTIASLLTSTFVYVLVFILLSFVGKRDEMRENTAYFSLVAFPDFGLNIGTYIVKAGMLIAILGEGIQALVVAPRVVQAIVDDNIISFIPLHYLTSKGSVNMRKATLFSALLAIIPLFLGNLESISTFIAMLILFSFAFLNISTFVASISPNWRPRWMYYHWSLGVFGFFVCAICMFLIGWYWTLLCAIIGLLLYILIEVSNETNAFGEAMSGVKLQTALNALYSCETNPSSSSSYQEKSNWRPQLLCLVKILPNNTISHADILNVANQLKKGQGLCVVAAIIEGNYKKKYKIARKEQLALALKMKEKSITGFSQVIVAKNFQEGINHLIQNCGLGPLTPNTIVSGFPMSDDKSSSRNFVEMLKYAEISRKAVIIAKGEFGEEEQSGFIDLYWIIYEGGLELLITFLLQKHKVWRKCKIRIYTVVDDTSSLEMIKEGVHDILYHLRFEAECHVLYMRPHDVSPFVVTHDQRERERMLKPSKRVNKSIFRDVRSMSYHEGLDSLVFNFPSTPQTATTDEVSINIDGTNPPTPTDETTQYSNVPNLSITDYLNTSSRINTIIRQHSTPKDTRLVIVNLPSLTSNLSSMDYVLCLKYLTQNISSKILLIKGSGKEVITHLLKNKFKKMQQHVGLAPPIAETGLISGAPILKNWKEEDLIEIGKKYRQVMISVDSVRFERNFKAAHDELLKAIDLCPFQPEAYYKRALLYFQTNNQKEMLRAVTITKFVCRGHPFWSLLCDGYIYEVGQNYEKSKELYLSAFKIEKETVLEYYQSFYSISRNMAETMYSLFDIFTPFFSIFNAGCVSMDLDLYTEAISEFETAITSLETACNIPNFYYPEHKERILNVGRALCYNNIGCCYINTENEEALKYLSKAVENCSNYILVYSNRISTNSRTDQFAKIVEDCETVLKFVKNPDQIEAMEVERISAIEKILRREPPTKQFSRLQFKQELDELSKKYPKNYTIYITRACSAGSLEEAIDIISEGVQSLDGSAVVDEYKLLTLIEFRSQLLSGIGETVQADKDLDFVTMAFKSEYLLRIE